MTSRERILAVLRGGIPDRVPVWAWGIHPWLADVHPSIQPVVDAYLDRGDVIHWWSPGAGTLLTGSDQLSVTNETRASAYVDYQEHDIETMRTAQFREMVSQTAKIGMEGGRFILSPTATPFGWPTMETLAQQNWIAMLDTALEAGWY